MGLSHNRGYAKRNESHDIIAVDLINDRSKNRKSQGGIFMKKIFLRQNPSDKLTVLTDGKYKGHEAIVRTEPDGKIRAYVLDKNEVVKSGPVKIIDILDCMPAPSSNESKPYLH